MPDARLDVIFWAACGPQLAPAPAAGKRRPGSPCASPRPRGKAARAFRSSFDSSEALRACSCRLRFLTTKDGLDKPPPLATRFSVTQIAKLVKATYLGGELRPQKPTSTGAPPIHVPLQRRDPPSAPPCCLPELRANLSDMPNEGRQPS